MQVLEWSDSMNKIIFPVILAILLSTFSAGAYATRLVEEPNVPDDSGNTPPTDWGTEAGDTQSEGATSFDFSNGDKGCDTNHQNCRHLANHDSNKGNKQNNDTPMTKLVNNLPNGCMIVKGPTSIERVAGIRTTIEITCEGSK